MENALKKTNALLTWFEEQALRIAGLTTFLIMVIVAVDVARRYIFNHPFSWSYDLIGIYLVPLSFFFAVSATFRRNHHIAVDLFYLRAGELAKRLARLVCAILFLPFLVWIIVLAVQDSYERYVNGDAISGAVLWPTWIPAAMVATGFLLLMARLILDAVALAVALARRLPKVAGESPARSAATVDVEDGL